ncbi:hypothetical protein ACKAV7_010460 [Fusarium commune]
MSPSITCPRIWVPFVAPYIKFKSSTASQGQPPFFRLPAEMRNMIYKELFGGRVVHIWFHRCRESYHRKRAPNDAMFQWLHCVCHRGREAAPHFHEESDHEWSYLSTSILRACQSTYMEGIPVLYGTNTLSFRCPVDLSQFQDSDRHFSRLVQVFDLYGAYDKQHWQVDNPSNRTYPLSHDDRTWLLSRAYFDMAFEAVWLKRRSGLVSNPIVAPKVIFVKRIPENPSVAKAIKKIRNMLPNMSIEVVMEKEGIAWDLGERDEDEQISISPSEASDVED